MNTNGKYIDNKIRYGSGGGKWPYAIIENEMVISLHKSLKSAEKALGKELITHRSMTILKQGGMICVKEQYAVALSV